ncbi:MAG: hypothetical protein H6R14_1064 [Proteobacteria bacterium]|nr:hypothetical protein [Pseudomonadota bacterium]
MKDIAPPSRQRGVALLALLVMVLLAGGYAFYRSANLGNGQNQERDIIMHRLTQAKEAVIAYAVNDATRPGRLLCPDIIGDGNSPLFVQDDCASYGGLLPWATLNLAEKADLQGTQFRYNLSPAFGGKNINKVLNSDTPTSLRLDVPAGSSSNDVAAVIIATRGQPDTVNADGDDYFYNGKTTAQDDNDIVIAITRQELMAAVEQRIANELRTCLDQHSSAAGNVERTYPWPAPLSNNTFKGVPKSLFGMVPDTQPGNSEMALKETLTKLTQTRNTLSSAATVDDQIAAAIQLQDQTAYARALFDRLYLAAVDLSDKANKAKLEFTTLDTSLAAVTKTKDTYTALSNTLPGSIASALPSLLALNTAIQDNGFDLFLMELLLRNPELKASIDIATTTPTKSNFDKLITPINELKNNLHEFSWTQNTDIDGQLDAAMLLAKSAATSVNLARANLAAPIVQQALADATALYDANRLIEAKILSYRVNVDANEVSARAGSISTALSASGNDALIQILTSTQSLVKSISTGSATLLAARLASLSALENALAAATSGLDQNQIRTTAQAAATQLETLSLGISRNGDNVALETLNAAAATLGAFQQTPPANVTKGRDLRAPVDTVIYWSDTAIRLAADLARQARKGISAQDDSDSSAYTAARKLLDSLDGSTGAISILEQYKATPSAQNATLAQNAVSNSLTLLNALLNVAANLDSALETSIGSAAIPPVWYGNACLFLKPSTGAANWWTANGWKALFFYQISERIRPPTGVLSVNGSGNYRAVALAAGKALPTTQNRALRDANNYLEKMNGDASRNGDAQTPITRFVTEPVSPAFNDRLAY